MIRRVYEIIRKSLSPTEQATLSKIIFKYSGKPFVRKDKIPANEKFPNKELGGMIISADFELAWAFRYSKSFNEPNKAALSFAKQDRKNLPNLLKLFEEYNIPITWATVGHLFLKECKKGDHNWMHRIPYFENKNWRYKNGDWFDSDPYSNYKIDNEWYAADLIEMILQSKIPHEISTHTFTHIDFSDKNCPSRVAEDEILACIEVMKPYGLSPKSIVFPGGTFGNIPILKNNGIQIYRKNVDEDLAYPYHDDYGLLISPTTTGFGRSHKSWSAEYYFYRFKTFIDKAITTGTISHFWFHPSFDEWTLQNVMPSVFEYANELRSKNLLWIGTMSDIARHINNNQN
jgi:peptidoglycan/xylan/chitin deacetylase (PgdA/CDA1 family)